MAATLKHLAGTFTASNAEILQQVFPVKVTENTLIYGTEAGLPNEAQMASLRFTGDYSGRLWIAVDGTQADAIIDRLFDMYAIKTPVVAREVFAEMLNVFAANMTMHLAGKGIQLVIGPPDVQWPSPAEAEGAQHLVIAMHTSEGFPFAIYYVY